MRERRYRRKEWRNKLMKTLFTLVLLLLCSFALAEFPKDFKRLSISNTVKRDGAQMTCLLEFYGGDTVLNVCISRTGERLPVILTSGLTVDAFQSDGSVIQIVPRGASKYLAEVGDGRGTTASAAFNVGAKSLLFPLKVEVTKNGIKDVFIMEKQK